MNYHHLFYFWTVAREGSVNQAARVLNLSQPALSTQIRRLEESLGEKLFMRVGRSLALTETGRMTLRYADEIFTLGKALQNELKGRPTGRPLQLSVGISDALPKRMVHLLLRPALRLSDEVRLRCLEGDAEHLVGRLLDHQLDLVLGDMPEPARGRRLHNHLLGICNVEWFAEPKLRERYPGPFPACLNGAPVLLPMEGTSLRQALDQWFREEDLHPVIAGEFEDSALLSAFGVEGEGYFTAPAMVGSELVSDAKAQCVGATPGIHVRAYAITTERKLVHPAVQVIQKAAKKELFGA